MHCYSAAEKADYSVINELMSLLQRPYDEGPYLYIHTYMHILFTYVLLFIRTEYFRHPAAGAEVVPQHAALGKQHAWSGLHELILVTGYPPTNVCMYVCMYV